MTTTWWDDAGADNMVHCVACGWVRTPAHEIPARCPACIPALSLLQPYASAIVVGTKRAENRPKIIFRPPPSGIWVAVHASLGWWKVDADRWLRLWPGSPGLSVPHDPPLIGSGVRLDPDAFTRGVILGVAHVVGVRSFVSADVAERVLGPWAFGPICYILDDARALAEPIPAKGHLGLWRTEPEHQAALRALVGP